jgi:hypothetical protein
MVDIRPAIDASTGNPSNDIRGQQVLEEIFDGVGRDAAFPRKINSALAEELLISRFPPRLRSSNSPHRCWCPALQSRRRRRYRLSAMLRGKPQSRVSSHFL